MTLENYWSILLKRWHILVICVVVVGLGAYIGSRLMTPVYQSNVLVQVTIHTTSNSTDYNNLLASNQLVQTEAQLATSSPVMRDVISRFPGMTVDQLTSATTTSPKLNTQLFEIAVADVNPRKAAALANDIANTLIKQQIEETQLDNNRSQQQLQHEVDAARQSVDAGQRSLNDIQLRIAVLVGEKGAADQIAALQAQMSSLQSQLSRQQEYYNQWQTMLTQLRLTEAQNSSFLRIAQPAQPATSPVRPQILLNTVSGIVAGLFLGFVLIVLFEQLDTRVRTPEELSLLLSWPILSTIWNINSAKSDEATIISPGRRNVNAESYRILRTNIGFAAVDKPIRSLVVTSAMPYDGKSTIAANLAIFMARAGKNTLLVDADLHRPTIHTKFLIHEDMKGLSDAIVACSQDQSFVSSSSATPETVRDFLAPFLHSVDIDHLCVMPAGSLPPNPSELLDSIAMSNLLSIIMSSKMDVVIFDTPPLLGLADTRSLTPKVDGTVIVADITRVTRNNLQQVKTLLKQSGTRVLGCVVNKQSRVRGEVPYYYYDRGAEKEQEKKSSLDEHDSASSHAQLLPVGSEARKKSR
jgi:capsular exopolysaccharide synthesis family protein